LSRYSIIGATPEQVTGAGGTNVKPMRFSGIVFADMEEASANILRAQGATVAPVNQVGTDLVTTHVMPGVETPVPIAAIPTYSPADITKIAGFDELRAITDPPLYGEGINLAVIGTGIRETHEQINGRVVYRKNYTTDTMDDGFDHDTGCAAIAITVAPKCGILNMKVIGSSGQGSEEDVVEAIEDCITLHETGSEFAPSVLNLSLGTSDDGNPNTPLRVACRTAIEVGLWVFAAAGNLGPYHGTITSPASERYVFAVGSSKYLAEQQSFIVSDFSSRGPTLEGYTKPDGVLFGEDVLVASSKSDTATIAKSGTSFAAPFGAGMAVIFLDGINRQARTLVDLGDLPAANFYFVPPATVIDTYFPRICIKPTGIASGKDQEYGWGLPYGPKIMLAVEGGAGLGDMTSILPLMMMIPMMGMMMKTMSGSLVTAKSKAK